MGVIHYMPLNRSYFVICGRSFVGDRFTRRKGKLVTCKQCQKKLWPQRKSPQHKAGA